MSLSTNPIRAIWAYLDLDRPSMREVQGNSLARTWTAVNNAASGILETANAFPGISQVSGWVSMGIGAIKMFFVAGAALASGEKDAAAMFWKSGAKTAGLGAAAVFAPGWGNYLNAAAAAKDYTDALNMLSR